MTNDWRFLVITCTSPRTRVILHHNGKPVLMIWGFFSDRFGTNLAHQIIDFFQE